MPKLEFTLCIKHVKHVKIKHINAESMIYYDVNVLGHFKSTLL